MGRAAKIAGAAAMSGLALAIALVIAAEPSAPRASVPRGFGADAPARPGIARCRAVTTPDPECEAVWEARQRQFFGQKEDAR